ncbi:MAG: DMT family transporter [Marinibacterium sp.]|nr:DMT family transporter [Marinibacterium sp.]
MTPQAQGHLAMLAFSALVAGSFALGARVANDVAPAALTAVRFGLSALLMAAVAVASTGIPRRAFAAPWRYAVLGALFGSYFVLMFEGLKTAPPVSAAAVFTLTPVLSGLFGWLLLRQVTTPRMALALAIGATGALWVIFRGDWQAAQALQIGRGEWIYFLGCIAHAAYTPMVRLLNRGEPPVVFVLGILVAGAICLTAYGWGDIRVTDWAALPPRVWIALAYLSVFATCASFVMVLIGTLRLPSAKVMAYTYLTPAWVILWEIALGAPAPTPLVLVGIALTGLALGLLLRDDGG